MTDLLEQPNTSKPDSVKQSEDILTKSLDIRSKMIDALAPNGVVSSDAKNLRLLNEILNGTEATALGVKKLKADEGAAASTAEIVAALVAFVNSGNVPKDKPRVIPLDVEPELTFDVSVKLAPGELDQGTHVIDYDTVMGKR
jgi:hypothetical protein